MSDLKYIILDKIKQNIVCENVEVNNKSHLHQHHAQSPKNNNSHFEVIISSAELLKYFLPMCCDLVKMYYLCTSNKSNNLNF